MQAGLFCGNVFPTLTLPLVTCAPSLYGSTRLISCPREQRSTITIRRSSSAPPVRYHRGRDDPSMRPLQVEPGLHGHQFERQDALTTACQRSAERTSSTPRRTQRSWASTLNTCQKAGGPENSGPPSSSLGHSPARFSAWCSTSKRDCQY